MQVGLLQAFAYGLMRLFFLSRLTHLPRCKATAIPRLSIFLSCIFLLCACQDSQTHEYQGYIESDLLYVSSPDAGLLEELVVQQGQEVHQGALLYSLDKSPQKLEVEQRQADLYANTHVLSDLERPRRKAEIDAILAQIDQVKAKQALAQARTARYQKLYDKKVVGKDTLDEVIAEQKQTQAQLHQYEENLALAKQGSREQQILAQDSQVLAAKKQLAIAAWQLAQKKRRSPVNGIIFDTFFQVGEWVPAQQAVLAILPQNKKHIEFFVPLKDMSRWKLGKEITFSCSGCTLEGRATVTYISPKVEYAPPLVYSRDNADKLVFRLKAQLLTPGDRIADGLPVTVKG